LCRTTLCSQLATASVFGCTGWESGLWFPGRRRLVGSPLWSTPSGRRRFAAPLHTHADEDEISYVLEGEVGMQIGDRELRAGPGTLVFKPRGVPHAFWNPGDAPARMLELISPAGFEHYFEEAADLYASGPRDAELAAELRRRYRLEMDLSSIPHLLQVHGLAES
jgi:mannose-6-phosphate isomerase-like protein (cupin superfamily)